MSGIPQLKTERLILRGFKDSDAPEVQKLAGSQAIAATTLNIPHPYEAGMAEKWIATHQVEFDQGLSAIFAIILAESNELVGAIGLGITAAYHRAELGYWVGKPFWDRGYATEAATELLRYGFLDLSLNRIFANHMTHNPASGAVMRKIGMSPEGVLKQHAFKENEYVDLAIYGIVAETWYARQNP